MYQRLLAITFFLLFPAWSAGQIEHVGAARADLSLSRQQAVQCGVGYLLGLLGPKGPAVDEPPPESPSYGERTALVVYSLLSARADMHSLPLKQSLAWLVKADLKSTHAVAYRACALAELPGKQHQDVLAADAARLISSARDNGSYARFYSKKYDWQAYDNFSSYLAVVAIHAASQRGVQVPADYWRRVQQHWTMQQQGDGGWGYRILPPSLRTRTYGSMSAAGLAVLMICREHLNDYQTDLFGGQTDPPPIARSMDWLGRNFSPAENPSRGVHYYYEWLEAVRRVGNLSGYRNIGNCDWFQECSSQLLGRQNPDGSWSRGDRLTDSALAVIFLSSGNRAIFASKLSYEGRWNTHPRDLANLTRFLSNAFERPLGWQIVSLDAPPAKLHEGAILYISGSGPVEMSTQQIEKLRRFVLEGGLIVSQSAGNNTDFTMDILNIYRKMLPEFQLARLPDDHDLYSLHFDLRDFKGLHGVSNGVRLLAVHSPVDLSQGLQQMEAADKTAYNLFANIYLYVTDGGHLTPGSIRTQPIRQAGAAGRTIRIARLAHGGNCDPEPLAWEYLAAEAFNRFGIDLNVTPPMDPALLDDGWPIAVMCGTEAFTLSADQQAAIRRHFERGGVLIADSAGGAEAFAESFRQQVLPLVNQPQQRQLPDSFALDGPWPIDKASYRPAYSSRLGASRDNLRLIEMFLDDKPVIVFSPDDLTAGLMNIPLYNIKGYDPACAQAIMLNLLANLDRGISSHWAGRQDEIKPSTDTSGPDNDEKDANQNTAPPPDRD